MFLQKNKWVFVCEGLRLHNDSSLFSRGLSPFTMKDEEEYKFGELSFLGVQKKTPKVIQLSIDEVRQAHASKGLDMSSYDIPDTEKQEESHPVAPVTHPLDIPEELNARMYDHQKEGVQWMYDLRASYKGGILGDDMGLGKTFQSEYPFLFTSYDFISLFHLISFHFTSLHLTSLHFTSLHFHQLWHS